MPQLQAVIAPNTGLTEINDKAFRRLSHLVDLELTDNPLTSVHDDAFDTNPLQQLYLSNCSLKSVPTAVKRESTLSRLDLPRNGLTQLAQDDFLNLTQLTLLNIQANPIKDIAERAFENNRELLSLQISLLPAPRLPLSVFDALTKLELLQFASFALTGSTRLEDRHFERLRSLTVLELSFQRQSTSFVASWDKSFATRYGYRANLVYLATHFHAIQASQHIRARPSRTWSHTATRSYYSLARLVFHPVLLQSDHSVSLATSG